MTTINVPVEYRADGSGLTPGRLIGRLMRYGETAQDRPERFAPGALRWPADGVVLRRQHARGAPIMRVVPEVRGADVVIDVPLPDTAAGRDAAREVRDGLFKGLSVEFRALRQRYDRGVRVVTDALLSGAGLVDDPSYRGSTAEVRRRAKRRAMVL